MVAIRIRSAHQDDLPELVRIYNHYVMATHITFDVEPFSIAERRIWFDGFSLDGPHRLLVADVDARTAGYASSKEFRAKPAYRMSVETTIYLDPLFVGRGVGKTLYGALLEALQAEPQVHRAYGVIALPNPASVALHEQLGFRLVGTLWEVGYKFGKYWDVSWYEKEMSAPNAAYRVAEPESQTMLHNQEGR
jgi:phosphinothricin acetyltransferase